ncbi:MAG: 50S ribosomal protein L20 [Candidatus Campbellbacteria bacterium]|nr:50S ribosomal protein L20 [Candidatus Campbellbacteria bacterium]
MTRVKRGTTSIKRRRTILKRAKGFRNARSTKERQAREGLYHAGNHAFAHRRDKKNVFRRLWQGKINARIREHGMSYSKFMHALKENNVNLDRKTLANLAENQPDIFAKIVESVK